MSRINDPDIFDYNEDEIYTDDVGQTKHKKYSNTGGRKTTVPVLYARRVNQTKCKLINGKYVVPVRSSLNPNQIVQYRSCPNPWSYPRPYNVRARIYDNRRLSKYAMQYIAKDDLNKVARFPENEYNEDEYYPEELQAQPEEGVKYKRRGPNPNLYRGEDSLTDDNSSFMSSVESSVSSKRSRKRKRSSTPSRSTESPNNNNVESTSLPSPTSEESPSNNNVESTSLPSPTSTSYSTPVKSTNIDNPNPNPFPKEQLAVILAKKNPTVMEYNPVNTDKDPFGNRLKKTVFRKYNIKPDGDCFFWAFITSLAASEWPSINKYPTPETIRRIIRFELDFIKDVVIDNNNNAGPEDHLIRMRAYYKKLMSDKAYIPFDTVIEGKVTMIYKLVEDGTNSLSFQKLFTDNKLYYADRITMRILIDLYNFKNVVIYIYRKLENNQLALADIVSTWNFKLYPNKVVNVHIIHDDYNHFDLLIPVNDDIDNIDNNDNNPKSPNRTATKKEYDEFVSDILEDTPPRSQTPRTPQKLQSPPKRAKTTIQEVNENILFQRGGKTVRQQSYKTKTTTPKTPKKKRKPLTPPPAPAREKREPNPNKRYGIDKSPPKKSKPEEQSYLRSKVNRPERYGFVNQNRWK